MTYHTVHISDETYQLLLKQARRLQTTPEAVLEQLARELDLLPDDVEAEELPLDEPEATIEALAAVKRLTNLFADVTIPNFEQLVNDPAFALENVNILSLTYRDLHSSRRYRETYGLLTSDSLMVAAMQREHITYLATNDPDFERIPNIAVRLPG